MKLDISYSPSAMKRIALFLRRIGAEYSTMSGQMRATMLFTRALKAMVKRRSKVIVSPTVVVAYYDDDICYRTFDTIDQAFKAYLEYRSELAPAMILTLNSVRIREVEEDDEVI